MRSATQGRFLRAAAVLILVSAVPSSGADDALAAGAEMRPSGIEVSYPVEPEPGSSEADFQGAVAAARHAPRLRPFDAAAHDRAKRLAPAAADAIPGKMLALDSGLAPTAAVTHNFAGLNRATSVNNGFVFFPPDTHVAKGSLTAIEATNSAIRIFNNAGGVLSTANLNTFFGAATANGLVFDPKVIFDRNATNRRYYVVGLQKAGDNDAVLANNVSRIWIAVSRSADPPSLAAANWCRYNLDGRLDATTANASWADYPGLGNGFDSLLASFNNFRFSSPRPFMVAQVKAIRKIGLANNAASCPVMSYFTFRASSTFGNVDAFTLQPAQSYTTPSSFAGTTHPAYLVSNRATTPSATSRLWRIRNVAGAPTMQFVSFANAATTTPPDAPQPGGGALIDTGDVRLLGASAVGNFISAVHTTSCQFGVGATEACTVFRRLIAGQSVGGTPTVAVSQTLAGYGYGENSYSFWPSVAAMPNHSAMMTFQVIDFSPVVRLSTFVNLKTVASAWTSGFNVASGACSQTLSNRSGDYTAAVLDPLMTSFWFAGERTLSIAGSCQWDTRWGRAIP